MDFLVPLLSNDFDIKYPELSHNADILIKPKTTETDKWLQVKLEEASQKNDDMHMIVINGSHPITFTPEPFPESLDVVKEYVIEHDPSIPPPPPSDIMPLEISTLNLPNVSSQLAASSNIALVPRHIVEPLNVSLDTQSLYIKIKKTYANSVLFCYESSMTYFYIFQDSYQEDMQVLTCLRKISSGEIISLFKSKYENGYLV